MANKSNKYYPVQNQLLFAGSNATGLSILEIPRGLSGLNRRLYRQNRVYRVKVDCVGDVSTKMELDVFRLRDTFMLQRGYEEAMIACEESFQLAEEAVKDRSIARWRDFRIDTKPHISDTKISVVNLRSTGAGISSQPVVYDQYEISKAYKPDGTEMDFGLRSDPNTFDIISEYNKMGKVSSSPSAATTEAAYGGLASDLNDSEVSELQLNGAQPPYDADDAHPLDVLEYVGTIFIDNTAQVALMKTSTGFFDAPLGVIYIKGKFGAVKAIDDGETDLVKVTVQHGDYKGVNAHEYVSMPAKEE